MINAISNHMTIENTTKFAKITLTSYAIATKFTPNYFVGILAPLIGCAPRYLDGRVNTLVGAAVPILFYLLTDVDRAWVNCKDGYKQFKTLIKTILSSQVIKVALGVVIVAALIFSRKLVLETSIEGQLPGQVWHKETTQNYIKSELQSSLYYEGGLRAPFIEEVVFRGFLMDVVYAAQKWQNPATVNTTTQKTVRIGLQAILFSAIHYLPAQRISNYLILNEAFVLGCAFGYLAEKTSNIAVPFLYHSVNNLLCCYLSVNGLK